MKRRWACSPGHGFRDAPDLDGDGVRDVIEASIFVDHGKTGGNNRLFYIDALSGKDGRTLWWWNHPAEGCLDDARQRLACLRWWQDGARRSTRAACRLEGLPLRARRLSWRGVPGGRFTRSPPWPILASPTSMATAASTSGVPGEPAPGDPGDRPRALAPGSESWQRAADYDGDGVDDLIRNHTLPRSHDRGHLGSRRPPALEGRHRQQPY